jgi:hypothetical protein
MFKLCDSTGCKYDMKINLGRNRQRVAQHLTANHATHHVTKRWHWWLEVGS